MEFTGRPIWCPETNYLSEVLPATIIDFWDSSPRFTARETYSSRLATIAPLISVLISHLNYRIRALGSAALNMCAVAAGEADAYYEFGLHVWDMAAGALICTEAGAVCKDPSGRFTRPVPDPRMMVLVALQ